MTWRLEALFFIGEYTQGSKCYYRHYNVNENVEKVERGCEEDIFFLNFYLIILLYQKSNISKEYWNEQKTGENMAKIVNEWNNIIIWSIQTDNHVYNRDSPNYFINRLLHIAIARFLKTSYLEYNAEVSGSCFIFLMWCLAL
jgi:hypothetical protein